MFRTAARKSFHKFHETLHRFGLNLNVLSAASNLEFQVVRGLSSHAVDLVLDVGANKGQYARAIRRFGYTGKIVSFEPLKAEHTVLSALAAKDEMWWAHPRCAIGAEDGETSINISENSVSSSLLKITTTHTDAAVASRIIGTETVPVRSLDTAGGSYLEQAQRPFLKIDTQGFEWAVLDGASNSLDKIHGIQCEVSLKELYSGQKLFDDVRERIQSHGFSLWGVQNGFSNRESGETLQLDLIFFKS
jgi:FkbM family methyltransferase